MKLICKSCDGWIYKVKNKLYKIVFYSDCELDKEFGLEFLSVYLTSLDPKENLYSNSVTFKPKDSSKNYNKLKKECIKILKKIDD